MEVGSGAFLGQQFGPPVSLSDEEDEAAEMTDGQPSEAPIGRAHPDLAARVVQLEADLANVGNPLFSKCSYYTDLTHGRTHGELSLWIKCCMMKLHVCQIKPALSDQCAQMDQYNDIAEI